MRWRADTDKTGVERVAPLSQEALRALEDERNRHPAIGDAWVFPSPTDPTRPCSRNLVRDWWYRGQDVAGLPHLPRTAWHGLRRKFTTEVIRGGGSLKDVCELGGWKDAQTILRHYLKTDERSMRDALDGRKRVLVAGGE